YPKAVAPEMEFSFGTMGVLEQRHHTFVIENKGEAPLVLKTGTPTCKCTVGKLASDTIPVGEKADIELTWKAAALAASCPQSVPILTNDPENREFRLSVVGDVVDVLTLEPGGTWSLGDITEDKPVTVHGTIFSKTLDKFEIKSIESDSKLVTAETT